MRAREAMPGTVMVVALIVALVVCAGVRESHAQAGTLFDHLKCYSITFKKGNLTVDGHALDPLVLTPFQNPPFAVEDGCRLQPAGKPKPVMFCVPVDKKPRQSPSGTQIDNDFLVYKMKCPSQEDLEQGVQDQFVKGVGNVRRKPPTRYLLVPAYKIDTPPPPCEPTAPHMCSGTCPNTTDECRPGTTDICGCFPTTSEPCHWDPAASSCGGSCPAPQTCTQIQGTISCQCQ